MSETAEIEFENADSPRWLAVRDAAAIEVDRRLQNRYDAVCLGADMFKANADDLVKQTIRKPPGRVSSFGAIVEIVAAACEVVVPEAGLLKEIVEEAGAVHTMAKAAAETVDKAREEFEANTVEEAQEHLGHLSKQAVQAIKDGALHVKDETGKHAGTALDRYINANPQPFRQDESFTNELCVAIGVPETVIDRVQVEAYDKLMPSFVRHVEEAAARLHFFHEMSNDFERLDFLMDMSDQGTNPDDFLRLIEADVAYWDRFLSVFRSDGRDAAKLALENHIMGG